MNETIQKAIALAKELNGERIYLTNAVQLLIDVVLECEQPQPPTDDEYEYHTTPGTVIGEGWEYEMTPGYWCKTGQAGDKIGDTSAVKLYRSKKVKQPEPEKWVPKAGEWAKTNIHCPSQPLGSLVRLTQVKDDAAKFVDTTGALRWWAIAAFTQPTPSEISIAERRERLPPIPPGMVWVVDRTEKPHPEAMVVAGLAECGFTGWKARGLGANAPYLIDPDCEYIKPAEQLADTVSIPVPKDEPLMFTFYAGVQEG